VHLLRTRGDLGETRNQGNSGKQRHGCVGLSLSHVVLAEAPSVLHYGDMTMILANATLTWSSSVDGEEGASFFIPDRQNTEMVENVSCETIEPMHQLHR
jgi:hypothetical protein